MTRVIRTPLRGLWLTALAFPAVLLLAAPGSAEEKPASPGPDIAFETFELDNGLTVIVHEDHQSPIVAVHLWYHVGSKNERPGKTGFAHLFEHLMFNGSENLNEDWFVAMEEAGATGMNGTTNWDRTNYFQTVPSSALDRALWMESDRMGHLLGAIDQAKLDEQRGVVQNEKRQRENAPYGQAWNTLSEGAFPSDHPYSWPVIGSLEDLDAASLEDVHEWFREYYGASNAVLVLAGDIDMKTAREKVEKYFGDIPAGPPLSRHASWVAPRTESRRQVLEDRVPQTRVYRLWNTAELGTADADRLEIAAQILGGDKNSRLYKELVHEKQWATKVSAYYFGRQLAGWFMLQADVRPGVSLEKVESAIDRELASFLETGPTKEELDRARTQLRAEFLRNLERLGGFHGVAGILASGQVYENDPAAFRRWLAELDKTTTEDVRKTARRWLRQGDFTLEIRPFSEKSHRTGGADRSTLPALGDHPALSFPEISRATLKNGMTVLLAERRDLPLFEAEMIFDAGYASDAGAETRPGTASFGLSMLNEGTQKLDALEVSAEQARLGANIATQSTLDHSSVVVAGLRENLDASLTLFADVVRNPGFREKDLERKRVRWLTKILQEKSSPRSMALRTLPPLLYGDEHAYGIPLTGSGTEASIRALETQDLENFHERWLRPDNATLLVVGDVDMQTVLPLVEKNFGDWTNPDAKLATKRLPRVSRPKAPRITLIDKPGAEQSVIIAGHVIDPVAPATYDTFDIMNTVIGGNFNSRLNMNLREDKHWSYGARTTALDATGQRPFFAYAPVQTDKTTESMQEILRELREYRTTHPATPEEIGKVVTGKIRKLPGRFETNASVRDEISDAVRFDWPEDRVTRYRERVEELGPEDIKTSARSTLAPDSLTWVVVGDLSKIEAPIRALGLGEVTVRDADGNALR